MMAKIQVIDSCDECARFDRSMYGNRCFHPDVIKPHPEGCIPKKLQGGFHVEFPKWCPLDDSK